MELADLLGKAPCIPVLLVSTGDYRLLNVTKCYYKWLEIKQFPANFSFTIYGGAFSKNNLLKSIFRQKKYSWFYFWWTLCFTWWQWFFFATLVITKTLSEHLCNIISEWEHAVLCNSLGKALNWSRDKMQHKYQFYFSKITKNYIQILKLYSLIFFYFIHFSYLLTASDGHTPG